MSEDTKLSILGDLTEDEILCPEQVKEKHKDAVNPQHYKFANFESFDIATEIAAESEMNSYESILFFNIFKYVTRFKRKNGVIDLDKANWYLQKLIEYERQNKPSGGE